VKTISRVVDRMLVLFPFEAEFYRSHGVEVTHVGHPLIDQVPELERPAAGERRRVCLLPGSRSSEIRHHLPVMARAAQLMVEESAVQASWIVADGVDPDACSEWLPPGLDLELVREKRFEAIAASDLALCASGTATLEVGLLGTPMIVVYKVSRITSWVGRALIRLPNISLVNLVLGRAAVPEVLQAQATPEAIRDVASSLLDDPQRLHNMTRDLAELRSRLGSPGASARAARVVESVLQGEGRVQ
jgi:lipid-A-disaccharide synthase